SSIGTRSTASPGTPRRSPAPASGLEACGAGVGRRPRPWDAALPSATVPPGYEGAEDDVQSAEPERHRRGRPGWRSEEGDRAEEDEAAAHGGDDAGGKGPAGGHRGAVEEEPGAGKDGRLAASDELGGQQGADHHRREE